MEIKEKKRKKFDKEIGLHTQNEPTIVSSGVNTVRRTYAIAQKERRVFTSTAYNICIWTPNLTLETTIFVIRNCRRDETIWHPIQRPKVVVELQVLYYKPPLTLITLRVPTYSKSLVSVVGMDLDMMKGGAPTTISLLALKMRHPHTWARGWLSAWMKKNAPDLNHS